MKYISDNKKIGVLPPDIIDNSKISTINNIKRDKNYSKMDDCKYKLKKGLKRQKDYIIINQHLWEWFSLNYSGGPEIKIIGDKTYTSTFLSPITENNEINHNNKIKENNENNNNYQQDKHIKEIKSKNINKLREKQPKEDKRTSIISFEQERNLLNNSNNFNKIKQEEPSSELESNELDDNNSGIVLLDVSSNKINSINSYTFNTKFCDFNNIKSKKKESFEDVAYLMRNKHYMS